MAKGEKLVMSVEEAGRALGVSRGTAYALVRTGQLPALRLGKRLVVPIRSIEKLLDSARVDLGQTQGER